MPPKKRPAKKRTPGAKKRPSVDGLTVHDRQAALEDVAAHNLARTPVEVVPTTVFSIGALLVQRNWLALIPGEEPERAIERILDHAMSEEGVSDSWNDVLLKAGVPWIAWSILRDDVEEAAAVYTAWQRRVASHYAHETISLADAMGWTPLELQTREKLRISARRWLAERFDPTVFGNKQLILKKSVKVLRVEIVDELPL